MDSSEKKTILVVDDDREIVRAIALNLESEGYYVLKAYDGMEALDLAMTKEVHLIIIDVMMPKLDGLSAIMKIRERKNLPIIVLSAKSENSDKVIGLSMGADDYVTKPFNPMELTARVKSQLRRYTSLGDINASNENVILNGRLAFNCDEHVLYADGEPIKLTATETKIVELLMRNPGRVYSRENLLNVVWGYEYIGDFRTVDVHIRRLREKLELDPANPEYIRTKWGVGYYLSARGPRRLENV